MHNFRVYWISLYMFRTVSPSIIRSPRLYIHHQVYVIQVGWLLASWHEMEKFHLVLANMQPQNLYDIYLMLCVQSWTPDDGRRDRPKHVEWYSVNSKIVHLLGFTIEIIHVFKFYCCICIRLCFILLFFDTALLSLFLQPNYKRV